MAVIQNRTDMEKPNDMEDKYEAFSQNAMERVINRKPFFSFKRMTGKISRIYSNWNCFNLYALLKYGILVLK